MDAKAPKFQVGDTVVVKVYGTVGKITAVRQLEGGYFYVVNDREGLLAEQSLARLEEYDGILYKKEEVNIELKFFIGDIVKVKGYGGVLFKIVGFRTEIWRYAEDAWEDVIYEMVSIPKGEWLEADEEELLLIADAGQADSFVSRYQFFYPMKSSPLYQLVTSDLKTQEKIDHLLDMYNDYTLLLNLFGDEAYRAMLEAVKMQIQVLSAHGGPD
ncbi:MAG: hypothetical protein LKH78_06470 [Weizmannia coagulans]|jgi:hypothetical protein|uniref:Uncharacterized protein n=1 Tax=Heyndrickxia coagulans TaxID=1398 RepID=A0A133K9G5_HEYCO|nr:MULTISPECIES: hypothetical protein [Heyndrickxia]NWN94781.1 hypothetical protein [Bacillus sp. (in: firmicutes)]KGT39752.1 hypothetical protein P421_03685 [Heyndrickxia coagulans P38]KWZ76171.1 hypothetical protein HMPREF3213_03924 [Heyndrickxia coagulans]KYC69521.1 hypothetical protein B4096_3495 [Heyndrickxia coagulans]MCI1575354.1 hypothetical protein [Heyndrickxia coagulans]